MVCTLLSLSASQLGPPLPDAEKGLPIYLEPADETGQKRIIRIGYRDVYGREIESLRIVTLDKNNEVLGPLEIHKVKKTAEKQGAKRL